MLNFDQINRQRNILHSVKENHSPATIISKIIVYLRL